MAAYETGFGGFSLVEDKWLYHHISLHKMSLCWQSQQKSEGSIHLLYLVVGKSQRWERVPSLKGFPDSEHLGTVHYPGHGISTMQWGLQAMGFLGPIDCATLPHPPGWDQAVEVEGGKGSPETPVDVAEK